MSCLPDDIMESVISYETAKDTWTDLVYIFEGPSDTKENRIMDLKLEYQTFRAKSFESLSHTYTRYKTLLNELTNDGVNLSKHEINISMEGLSMKTILSKEENSDDESSQFSSSQADPKIQKDYKAEYKKMKAKLALLEAKVSDDEEVTEVKVVMALADDELTMRKNHARNGEWVDIIIRKVNILLSMDEDADWQNYLNYINNDLRCLTKLRGNGIDLSTPLSKKIPGLGIMKHTKPETYESSSKCVSRTVTVIEPEQITPSLPTEVKNAKQETKINELTKLVQMLIDEKSILLKRLKNQIHSYDHFTSGHNYVIHIRGGMLAESSQSSESLIGVKRNTYRSTVHSTTDHNDFDHFKRETHQGAHLVPRQWMLKEYDWCQKKCLHLLHMDLFGPVSPMFINHEKYTPVNVDEYSRTDNGTEFRNHALKSFCDEKGISQNFSSPYERKNRTLIEAARTMLNGLVLKRIPDISYFYVFGCPVFIHNHKDHLGKFNAKADDGYFLRYSFVSKAFRVFNTRRQQVDETYHVTFDESMEAIRFTNTSVNEIGIDDSSRYPPDEFIHEDDQSRQYQANSDISYYVIPHGRSLTELTQEKHVPEVITPNEPETPHTEDSEGSSRDNAEALVPITNSLVPDVTQSQIPNQITTSSNFVPRDRWSKYQHIELVNIIGDPGEGMLTRSMAAKLTAASAKELNQFYRNKVWTLVPLLYGKTAIGSKWVFRNKKDKHGITTKNKAILVAQGYSQEEGIDYDETFAPMARMEAIRIFLAFATYMNFTNFQMDVKSAFLNGKLKEEVYVKQPPGFESSEFPDYVYKLDKALYGLKQAPGAWYETLSTFLIQNKFARERIDNTLFIYKYKEDVLFVQVYVDDIIFGSTSYKLCKQFEKLMTKKFEMKQYTRNLLKKYEISDCSSMKTPMVPPNNLGLDLASKPVYETSYRGMIGSLIYLKEKAPQVPTKYLVENLFVRVLGNSSQWLCRQLRDHILKGDIELHFIPTEYQLADIFTKPLDEPTFTILKA
ncbi:retrovirus-related pol polyprotein from transposon TNT 1-94 [Tanacetum coccineum]